MTESEAIEIVRKEKAYMDSHAGRAQSEAFQIAINALEKQIPKKVIKWANGTEHCPTCDCDNSCVGYGVCIDCGQKLDWSDSD